MVLLAVIVYFILFSLLVQKNFKAAVGFLIILLPSYFIRFDLGPLPSTLLELSFGALFLVWICKYLKKDFVEIKNFYSEHKIIVWLVCLLLTFSTLGIFISWEPIKSLGVWRAYFLEPILFFILLIGSRKKINRDDLIWFLSLSTISISLVAILQKITDPTILTTLLKPDSQGRVTSFFTSPNAVGLYLGPVVPLIFYGIKTSKIKKYYITILILVLIALLLSFSEGAILALGISIIGAMFLLGFKKTASAIVVFCTLAVILITPIKQSILFQNRSGQNRLIIWSYTRNYLSKNPINFIFGAGLSQFNRKIQRPVNDFKTIEPLIFPHNIILNVWSEIGLFGMIIFFTIYLWTVRISLTKFNKEKYFGTAVLMVLSILFIHGLVDAPYFKNDLSFLWWIIMAIIII